MPENTPSERPSPEVLDRAHAVIMSRIVETAEAPHYTALAAALDIDLAAARDITHTLVSIIPGWTHPGTDYLASFPPFNLQPTQYRISIDGQKGWFAQCGFEATAIRWLVPGKTVAIDAPCLCCGESMHIEMNDDGIIAADPPEIVGYTNQEVGGDAASRPFR